MVSSADGRAMDAVLSVQLVLRTGKPSWVRYTRRRAKRATSTCVLPSPQPSPPCPLACPCAHTVPSPGALPAPVPSGLVGCCAHLSPNLSAIISATTCTCSITVSQYCSPE